MRCGGLPRQASGGFLKKMAEGAIGVLIAPSARRCGKVPTGLEDQLTHQIDGAIPGGTADRPEGFGVAKARVGIAKLRRVCGVVPLSTNHKLKALGDLEGAAKVRIHAKEPWARVEVITHTALGSSRGIGKDTRVKPLLGRVANADIL